MTEPKSDRRSVIPPPKASARTTATPAATGYTTAMLLLRYGRCDDAVVASYVAGAAAGDHVTAGARVGAERIVRDGARMVGLAGAIVAAASPEQRETLRMVTAEFLSAAATSVALVDEAQALCDRGATTADAAKRAAAKRAKAAMTRGRAQRKMLYSNLITAAGGDGVQIARVRAARGVTGTPAKLAASIERMVPVGRELARLARERGVQGALDEAYFEGLLTLAREVREAGSEGDAVQGREGVGPGDVDRAGGVCLWFLQRIVELFGAAHAADASIARVHAISLRNVIKRGGRRPKKPAAPPTPPPVA